MELITDRTQAHVDRLNALLAKGWNRFSDSEKNLWYGEVAKGAYNYTDLNRVESAVAEIAVTLGLTLTTKTDWSRWDVPTPEDMARYLSNIEAVKNASPSGGNFPDVPTRMTGLTFEVANRIEEILLLAHRSADSIPRSGELFCGEV
jgi:hypothetical protein